MDVIEEAKRDLQNAKDAWVLKRLKFLIDEPEKGIRSKNPQRADAILNLIKTVENDLEMQIQAI